jgi:hypothetical protein
LIQNNEADRRLIVNLGRTTKLRTEDLRGKNYNIINGQFEGQEKWMGPLQKHQAFAIL